MYSPALSFPYILSGALSASDPQLDFFPQPHPTVADIACLPRIMPLAESP